MDAADHRRPGRRPGPGRRIAARCLDALLLGLPASIGLALAGLPAPTIPLGGVAGWGWTAVTVGVWFAYHAAAEATTGRTLGKRILGLQVVVGTGGPSRLVAAGVRNLWLLLGLVPIVGGVAWLVALVAIPVTIARSGDHRGVHDRVAGTTVVVAPPAAGGERSAAATRQWAAP